MKRVKSRESRVERLRRGRFVGCVLVLATALSARAEDDDAAMGKRLQDLLHAHQSDVFGCVRSTQTRAQGEMLMRVFVGEHGTAVKPEVLKDQSGGGKLGVCLVAAIQKWDLTALGGSVGDQIVFPLAFKPAAKKKNDFVH